MRDYDEEFKTIDLLERSDAESRGVDSFALAIIKVERQARKIFTFLIYQYPCFHATNPDDLINLLYGKRIYLHGTLHGIDRISPRTVEELIGSEYTQLFEHLTQAVEIRNKVLHGQITNRKLGREELFEYVHHMRKWCKLLGDAALTEYGYDGFGDSCQWSDRKDLVSRYKKNIQSIDEYEKLLDNLQGVRLSHLLTGKARHD